MKKTTMLRKFLRQPGLLVVPCAYDCISARMAQSVGFKALFMTGHGIRESQIGLPDIGLATATEVVDITRNMVNSVNIPLIVDGDDGYGGALAAYRTTQELIRVGAAGMFIDDQKHPTKGPSWGIQEVLPRDEYLGKVGAVLEARDREDKDFFVCARTDAAPTLGAEEMVARAKACVKLGVDMILPQSITSLVPKSAKSVKETFKKYYKMIGAPDVLIWGTGGPSDFSAKDYEEVGAKLMVPGNPIPVVCKILIELYKGLYDTGTLDGFSPPGLPGRDYFNKLEGVEFWNELEKKYVITKNI
jgi:2-methylisocitrate lyase-like PEP mutase family enzyme